MFFHIGSSRFTNFPNFVKHNNIYINFDSGWHRATDANNNILIYKGYMDDFVLSEKLSEIVSEVEPSFNGNFCVFQLTNGGINIRTNISRGFPLWHGDTGVTNLTPTGIQIWADSIISVHDDLSITERKYDIIGPCDSSLLSFDSVVASVDDILSKKILSLANNTSHPLKIFLSGGVDTMSLYSYVRKFNIPHEFVTYLHTDLDYFYLKNHTTIKEFWCYNQMHHWNSPCTLISGAYGDEFTARGPSTINLIAKYYGSSIPLLMEEFPNALHSSFFKRYADHWESQDHIKFDNFEDLIRQCCNINNNDFQHWHLGNTLTWTPFRDIELYKLVTRMNFDELKGQIMNGDIQRELITRNCPELLSGISSQKNMKNGMENLTNI